MRALQLIFLSERKRSRCPFACPSHAITDCRGSFFRPGTRDIAVFHRRNFNVQIDAIEQRSGNPLPITLHLQLPTLAFALQVAEIPARTGIQATPHLSMKTPSHLHRRSHEGATLQFFSKAACLLDIRRNTGIAPIIRTADQGRMRQDACSFNAYFMNVSSTFLKRTALLPFCRHYHNSGTRLIDKTTRNQSD